MVLLFHLQYHVVKAHTPLILLGVLSVPEHHRSFQAFNLLLTGGDWNKHLHYPPKKSCQQSSLIISKLLAWILLILLSVKLGSSLIIPAERENACKDSYSKKNYTERTNVHCHSKYRNLNLDLYFTALGKAEVLSFQNCEANTSDQLNTYPRRISL